MTLSLSRRNWVELILCAALGLIALYFLATGEPCGSGCF